MERHAGLVIHVQEIARHRNGISGAPFHVVTFRHRVEGEDVSRNMVATVFEEAGHVAVFDLDQLSRGHIAFGGTEGECNSWRGDRFESVLRRKIAESEAEERLRTYPVTRPDGSVVRVSVPPSE